MAKGRGSSESRTTRGEQEVAEAMMSRGVRNSNPIGTSMPPDQPSGRPQPGISAYGYERGEDQYSRAMHRGAMANSEPDPRPAGISDPEIIAAVHQGQGGPRMNPLEDKSQFRMYAGLGSFGEHAAVGRNKLGADGKNMEDHIRRGQGGPKVGDVHQERRKP